MVYSRVKPPIRLVSAFCTDSETARVSTLARATTPVTSIPRREAAISAKSLVLLDESLSSTGSFEASYIAAEVLAGLSRVGCRCIFSTHLHELAAEIDNINARTAPEGGVPIDTLVAGIEEEGRRSFRILRAKPDGKSYARDIATKYGLTYDNIIKTISNNKGE